MKEALDPNRKIEIGTITEAEHQKTRDWGQEWYDRFWEVADILKMPGSPSSGDVIAKLKKLVEQ